MVNCAYCGLGLMVKVAVCRSNGHGASSKPSIFDGDMHGFEKWVFWGLPRKRMWKPMVLLRNNEGSCPSGASGRHQNPQFLEAMTIWPPLGVSVSGKQMVIFFFSFWTSFAIWWLQSPPNDEIQDFVILGEALKFGLSREIASNLAYLRIDFLR